MAILTDSMAKGQKMGIDEKTDIASSNNLEESQLGRNQRGQVSLILRLYA